MKKVFLLLVVTSPLWARTYSTNFPATENPISQGSAWLNGGADGTVWNNVQTTPGKAFGVPSEHLPQYTDPTAILKGAWGPIQIASGTVFCANPTASYFQEVEIRLRSTMTSGASIGYELFSRCLKTSAAYVSIVRWNPGGLGQFTELTHLDGAQFGVQTGDVIMGTAIGNALSVYVNGVLLSSTTDNTYTSGGAPGMGFNYGAQATNVDFGFSTFAASDGAPAVIAGGSVIAGGVQFK